MTIPTPEPTDGDTAWFVRDRFGLFIHWGLYALPARHEWVKSHERITTADYEKYFRHFDPDLYDPTLWAEAAANAGMKYFVITTKHHEGFCLWDSALTEYKVTNTPYGKDVLRPMVHAFRERNLRVGFYHSIIDWHHPDYTLDIHHPQRDDAAYRAADAERDMKRYADYLHGQTRELLTQFGAVDILWYDFTPGPDGDPNRNLPRKSRESWQSETLVKLVRDLQPGIILNDRLDLPDGWDIKTPEQFQPRGWVRHEGKPVVWEACQTFSGSWGYHRDESSWKSVEMLILMLIDTVSKGGNLLLNVGPTGRGEFDERALSRLAGMGEWMKRHSRSIYGCTQAPVEFGNAPTDCRYTYNPTTRRLYVHVLAWPFGQLYLDGLGNRVEYAQLLNDASEVRMQDVEPWQAVGGNAGGKDTLALRLPIQKPNVTVPVIELYLK
ncbi:MAG: alpha-L-fucosidase [Capsulimonadales bacterium]|nr:alpha-L-fucosidase [Capsulimonadales bacterium]